MLKRVIHILKKTNIQTHAQVTNKRLYFKKELYLQTKEIKKIYTTILKNIKVSYDTCYK